MIRNAVTLIISAMMCACTTSVPGTLERLKDAADSGRFMYAHQDDLSYGHFWSHTRDIVADPIENSDVRAVCGDFPAIIGFDLGGIERADSANLDKVSFEFMKKAAETHIARGGMVTFSWHPRNPLTGGDAWDVSSDKVVSSILDGGEREDEFMVWLDRAAEFIASIRNPDGSQAQVIFRPWHEHMGSWFWWGKDLCTSEQYVALWEKTYECMVNRHGLCDIVWAYSPNSDVDRQGYMERYPGDGMVDLLGTDIYEYAGSENYIANMRRVLSYMTELGHEHGKTIIVSETGSEGIKNPRWWTDVLEKSLEGFNIGYVLTWRNACDRPEHFYGPYPGAACEQDFICFYESDRTMFLKDIR